MKVTRGPRSFLLSQSLKVVLEELGTNSFGTCGVENGKSGGKKRTSQYKTVSRLVPMSA